MRLLVISDIHVGSGVLDDFDKELEEGLVDFLGQLTADPTPTLLVINGDFLDFAQADPWQSADLESRTDEGVLLCFTEEQSLAKLKSIVRAHKATFDALGRLASDRHDHRVVLLPGNHDADFFWPRVREEFVHSVGHGSSLNDRLRFHLEQAYRPEQFAGVWIEHGHQHDQCNRFFLGDEPVWSQVNPPIRAGRDGVPRLIECVGTRFLLNFLNALDADYPFVDNVKPFSKFLRMFLASTVHRGFGPVKALVAYWGFLRFFAYSLGTSPSHLMSAGDGVDAGQGLKPTLHQIRDRLSEMRRSTVERLVHDASLKGFDFQGMPLQFFVADDVRLASLLDFLSAEPGVLDALQDEPLGLLSAGSAGSGYLTLGRGYLVDETAALKAAAADVIRTRGATTVVMGHTHEPVLPDATLNYVNVGSWTRYLNEAAGRPSEWSWSLLKSESYDKFPFELAYAEVSQLTPTRVARRVFRG